MEALGGLLGPFWSDLGGSWRGPRGPFWAFWWVLFPCRFRGGFGKRFGTDFGPKFGPKMAPQWLPEGPRKGLRRQKAKTSKFANPPWFLLDFCSPGGSKNGPQRARKPLREPFQKQDAKSHRKLPPNGPTWGPKWGPKSVKTAFQHRSKIGSILEALWKAFGSRLGGLLGE